MTLAGPRAMASREQVNAQIANSLMAMGINVGVGALSPQLGAVNTGVGRLSGTTAGHAVVGGIAGARGNLSPFGEGRGQYGGRGGGGRSGGRGGGGASASAPSASGGGGTAMGGGEPVSGGEGPPGVSQTVTADAGRELARGLGLTDVHTLFGRLDPTKREEALTAAKLLDLELKQFRLMLGRA